MNQIETIHALATPVAGDAGCELFDVELVGKAGSMVLRVYIDSDEGVTVENCAAVSRQLGLLLDAEDIIEGAYTLEVSSPGLTRQLKKPAHYRWAIGRLVKIRFSKLADERREVTGVIENATDETVTVKIAKSDESITARYEDISKAKLEFEDIQK